MPIEDADIFTSLLASEAGVKVVSGNEFGSRKHIRISFAVPEEALELGLDKMAKFVDSLS